jgi:ligand-binding SRPBCC domain-containing protein
MKWHARIEEFEAGRYFWDAQTAGPMRSWRHRHSFDSERRDGVDGTVISDHIEFEIGYGWAGRVVERYFVLPSLQKSFAHRQQQVERELQGG